MRSGLSLPALAIVVACAICAPAKAQVVDQPGGDAQWVPLASSVQAPKAVTGGSPDAVYSNLGTFRNDSYAAGGATQQVLNTITRLAADDLNLVGTPPYSINGFRFIVTNLNAVDVSARPLVRFFLPNGPGGGPGTLLEARTYNPIVFHAGVVGTIKTSSTFILRTSAIWAGIAFDNNSGTTGATAAQLDNMALGIFSPPEVGTSADQYFVTTAAGSFASDDPVGTLGNFGGVPPADFGWEILTAQNVDLSITNSDGVATTFPGGSVVYTITASNAGPDTVFDARVVDDFPASLTCSWTCAGSAGNTCAASGSGDINDATVGLAVGGSVTYTATCEVSPTVTDPLVNTATIFAPGTAVEGNVLDNTATDTDTIVPGPDLTIAKSHTGNFTQGQTGIYTLIVSNIGGSPTSGSVTIIDNVPIGLVPTSAAGAGWTCSVVAQGGAICNRSDSLSPGASYPPITLTVAVAIDAAASVTNTAIVVGGSETDTSNSTASDPTTIAAGPDLTLVKSHTGNFIQGQTGSYTFIVSNIGGSPTSGLVTVSDNVPIGLLPTSATGAGWTCNVAAQGVICNRSDPLAAGQSYPAITLAVHVQPNAPASVTNTGIVFGGGGTDASNNTSADPTTIVAGPDLTLVKSHTGNFTQGQAGTYTFTVSNVGGSPTTGPVTITDNVTVGVVPTSAAGTGWVCNVAAQGVTCTRSDALAPGTSYPPITLTVTVAADAPASVTNTATVSGGGDVNSGNDAGSDPTTIIAVADLTLAKMHTGSFLQGQVGATYTLTVSNIGGGPTSGAVIVADTLPAGLTPTAAAGVGWTCNIAAQAVTCSRSDALNAGASYPAMTLTVNVAPAAPPSLTNTAQVSGGGEINTANDTASNITTIGPGPDLTIAKSHAGNFTQSLTGTYTLIVSDNGGADTSGVVTVTDNVPIGLVPASAAGAGWTCNIAAQDVTCSRSDTLLTGQSYPSIALTVNVQPAAPASVTNTVSVSGGGEVNPSNNSAGDATTIVPGADLTIAKSHTGNFSQGQAGATYTVVVTNSGVGPTTAAATVIDTLPLGLTPTAATGAGWSCTVGAQAVVCSRSDVLAAGASYPAITITLNVAGDAPPTLTNIVAVTGGGGNNTANNTASDPTTIVPGPDLTIAKSHAGNFTQGQPGIYDLTVSNAGSSPTSGSVTVTDNVPIGLVPTSAAGAGWTCTIAAQGVICNRSDPLAPAASYAPITLTASIAVNAPVSVTNIAIVFGGGEINPSNNTSSDPTTINAGPDVTIAKSHSGNFTKGQTGTYTLIVSNLGGSPTSGTVTVTDSVPIGLVPTSAVGTGWACTIAAQGVVCNRSDALAAGGSYPPITLTVAVAIDAPASVTNAALVSGGGDVDPSNDAASDPTMLAPALTASVTGTKTVAGSFAPGSTVTYTITLHNGGTGAQGDNPGNEFIDVLPDTLALVSATSSSGTAQATVGNNVVTWNGAIVAGASVTITITATVSATATPGTTVSNQGTIATDLDGNGSNETRRTTDNPASGAANDPTTFTVTGGVSAVRTPLPALSPWSLALLVLVLMGMGLARRRQRV